MPLTDKAIKALKAKDREYKIFDGKGLYILVRPNGSKYWRLRYRFNGKDKAPIALGVYPEVSLVEAREKTLEIRKGLIQGIEPAHEKKLNKLKSALGTANNFEAIAKEWHENQKANWTKRHGEKLLRRLEIDAFPAIGYRAINEITALEILAMLRGIEKRDAIDIAGRIRQTCGQIFRYAVATGRAERDITVDLKGALKTRKKKHYTHLAQSELPEFLQKLDIYDGELLTKLGLKLLILTFVRTIELRGAKWEEIDFKKELWKIPAERMKMRKTHFVPLSSQAIEILKELKVITGDGEFIFPNRSTLKKFMSENTLLYAVYRMGYHDRTIVHGFRATASTILNENGFRPDIIEMQLSHAEGNKVRASYNHAQYMPERIKMMQWWGELIENKATTIQDVENVA